MKQKKKIPYFKLERESGERACRLDGWTFFLLLVLFGAYDVHWLLFSLLSPYVLNTTSLISFIWLQTLFFFTCLFLFKPNSLYWAFYWKLSQGRKDWKKLVPLCASNESNGRCVCYVEYMFWTQSMPPPIWQQLYIERAKGSTYRVCRSIC